MQNFSSLASLEVGEKFVVVGGVVVGSVEHVTTVSNSNVSYIRVALGFDNISFI